MRINLSVTAGPHTGQVFSFEEHDNFIVGRSKRAHFQLPSKDKYFSRIHFMVEVNPPQCRLMDMGSLNGTYVNGQKVDVADLKDGDLIKAGQTVLRVSVQGSDSTLDEGPEPLVALPASDVIPAVAEIAPPPPAPEPAPTLCRVCTAPFTAVAGTGEGLEAPDATLQPLCPACWDQIRRQPQPIAGYAIVRQIGRGAMGVVNLALRSSDGRLVALKTIIPAVAGARAHIDRFFREASILRDLDHPNIVAFRDMGESNGQFFFAMDYVRGYDAARLLRESGPMSIPRATRLVCQLLEALEYAHGKGFVHRDIKPANLLVEAPGGQEVAKLADFGLARVYQTSQLSGLTMTGDLGGTVAFMAPEQITHYREAKPPVDQYAAGATLYNLLTDKFAYDLTRNIQDQILMVLQQKPIPIQSRRQDIPKALADVIHRAMARELADRFPDVKTMRQALVKFC
jgi:serine/threonine-protein kinase